jgi:hypothetical protein
MTQYKAKLVTIRFLYSEDIPINKIDSILSNDMKHTRNRMEYLLLDAGIKGNI